MSSVPRFLLPRSLLPRSLLNPATTHTRLLIRCASKKASQKAAPKKPTKHQKPPPLQKPPLPLPLKYFSLRESLGSSDRPEIILYACHNYRFLISCYGLAGAMAAWSVYTFRTNLAVARPGLPSWVTKATWGCIALMSLMALAIVYYPTRIIQVIHAHSIPATATRKADISLTLHRRPILPILPMKKLQVASPDLITLGEPLGPRGAAKALEARRDKKSRRQKFWSRANVARLAKAFLKGISTSGFVPMRVEGMGVYRIHRGGWVWEERGLDRLFGAKDGLGVLRRPS